MRKAIENPKFKKYILNRFNLILVKCKLTKDLYPNFRKEPLYYLQYYHGKEKAKEVELKYGSEFYAFDSWLRYPESRYRCVLHRKDNILKECVAKETNNFFVYLFWRIIYFRKNYLEARRYRKNYKKHLKNRVESEKEK